MYIDLQGEAQYEAHRLSDPERIYFDLHDTALAPGLFGKTIEVGDPRLARVRIAQPRKGVSRVVLETTGASDFSVSVQANPYRLVVQIRKAVKPESGPTADQHPTEIRAAVTPQPSPVAPAPARAANKPDGQVRTPVAKFRLVLDAGHGGWDLGTVGRKGLMEKDLVLDIVGRLGKLVESRLGAEVIYTRQDDTYLPLEKRTEIANVAQADMFVSVHANYSNDSSARGAETYYTNTYSSVRARTPGTDADVTRAREYQLDQCRHSRKGAAVAPFRHRSAARSVWDAGVTNSRHAQSRDQRGFVRGAHGNFDAGGSCRGLLRQQSRG